MVVRSWFRCALFLGLTCILFAGCRLTPSSNSPESTTLGQSPNSPYAPAAPPSLSPGYGSPAPLPPAAYSPAEPQALSPATYPDYPGSPAASPAPSTPYPSAASGATPYNPASAPPAANPYGSPAVSPYADPAPSVTQDQPADLKPTSAKKVVISLLADESGNLKQILLSGKPSGSSPQELEKLLRSDASEVTLFVDPSMKFATVASALRICEEQGIEVSLRSRN